jgi:hypothetical protein
MNALQIIPPKPVARVRRSALSFRVSDAILLVALVGGMSMSRGEERTASEPVAAVVMGDSLDKVGGDDKSRSVMQPAAVSAGAAAEGSGAGGSDEKASASAPPIAPLAMSTPAGVTNDPKVDSEVGGPAAADVKSNTVVGAAIDDRTHHRNSSSVLANLSASSPASVVSKNDIAPKSADARVRNTPPSVITARTAEPVRRLYQRRGEVDYRSWRSADGVPLWSGPPPIVYGPGPAARARYVVAPAATTTMWERVVEAPGAVLNGGKQALYGILDAIW